MHALCMRIAAVLLAFALAPAFAADPGNSLSADGTSPAPSAAEPLAADARRPGEKLRVAVKAAPPFVEKAADGSWSGLAMDLWLAADGHLGEPFELIEVDTTREAFDGLAAGRYDLAVGALSVNAARERVVDFTLPFYNAGLGIAVNSEKSGWLSVLARLWSWEFFSAVGVLIVLLLAVGVAVWAVERRRNPDQFGGDAGHGIGNGFWFSAVTMTTVGYGDKAPVTAAGRLIALVWMFASVITVSGFTAAIASSITVGKLEGAVQTAADLPKARVASIDGTSGGDWLTDRGIAYRKAESVGAALDALSRGEVDAVVYDRPILRAELLARDDGSRVLDTLVQPEDYAFAVPQGSALRERLNPLMLDYIRTRGWEELRQKYLGR